MVRWHFSKLISPGDLVFDVGANVGELTHIFANLGANVIAIEPQSQCIDALKKRFATHSNVKIVEMGLGDRVVSLPIYVNDNSHAIATFSDGWMTQSRYADLEWTRSDPVNMTTLDCLISEYGRPKFCKIDVEGFEYPVLRGLSTKIPFISFEFLSECLNEARLCVEYLTTLGSVRFNYSLYNFYTYCSRRWLSSTELLKAISRYPAYYWSGDIYARFD
jgi:FkbM family methyltransferase